MDRIVCFHLFNDYSGSPKVLKTVLEGLLQKGYAIDLVSSKGGVLDELLCYKNCRKYSYPYAFSNNPAITMLRYCAMQLYTFLLALRWIFSKNTVFYINTLLPIGPALAGLIMGKRVIYHYHENATVKGAFYRILASAMQKLADEIICVSAYQASFLKRRNGITVIPNTIPNSFADKLHPDIDAAFDRKRILMLGSLKLYKSPLEFIELARRLPQFKFELVINDSQENIDAFIASNGIKESQNLTIYSRQNDVAPFYNRASLVLNLSNKRLFIETFGLTALEAMTAGLPIIVPTEGGIAEIVDDGVNGYKIDVKELDKIETHIISILSNKNLYRKLAENALYSSRLFSEKAMLDSIAAIISRRKGA